MLNTCFAAIKPPRFLLIGLLCFMAFSPALFGQFKGMDDEISIVDNPDIRSITNLPRIFTTGYFKGRDYYRPLVNASYMAEYHAFGLEPFFYNLDNLLLHVLNAWLVFILVAALWGERRKAWWAALLFAVHPLQWEAVGNISGRAILLCSAFALAAFILFLRHLKEKDNRLLAASALCFGLGLLCKESAAILLGVTAFYMFLGKERSWKSFVPFLVILAVYLAWRKHLGLTAVFPWHTAQEVFFGFTSFLYGVFTYLRLIIVPAGLYFDRSSPLIPLNAVFWPLLTWAAYAVLGAGLWFFRRRMPALVVFCVAWFFMELLPVSQILTSIGVQMSRISLAEHFLYMPLIPACMLVVMGADKVRAWIIERGIIRQEILRWVTGGVVALLVITSMQQAFYASNEAAMIKQSLAAEPKNARLNAALAMVYVRNGDNAMAEEHFRRAAALDPFEVRYRISIGKALADQGRYQQALDQYATIRDARQWQKLLDENTAAAARQLKK